MNGDGIDMYDLININDISLLQKTNKKFWVGVIEQMSPSPPIPRNKTKCFLPVPVYIYKNKKIFGMNSKNIDGMFSITYYIIPDNEFMFIQ